MCYNVDVHLFLHSFELDILFNLSVCFLVTNSNFLTLTILLVLVGVFLKIYFFFKGMMTERVLFFKQQGEIILILVFLFVAVLLKLLNVLQELPTFFRVPFFIS